MEQLSQVFPGNPDVMRGERDRQQIALMVKVEDLSEGKGPALPGLHHEHDGNFTRDEGVVAVSVHLKISIG